MTLPKGVSRVVGALLLVCAVSVEAAVWEPGPSYEQIPIWPNGVPDDAKNSKPESMEVVQQSVAGKPTTFILNVRQPTMTVFSPRGPSSGAAVIVFPGGGYRKLAIDLEGTEVCDWLTVKGVTCVLLKYRVPEIGRASCRERV